MFADTSPTIPVTGHNVYQDLTGQMYRRDTLSDEKTQYKIYLLGAHEKHSDALSCLLAL